MAISVNHSHSCTLFYLRVHLIGCFKARFALITLYDLFFAESSFTWLSKVYQPYARQQAPWQKRFVTRGTVSETSLNLAK